MALISSTDVQALLEALGGGDTATLGGSTVPCIIGGADFAQLADAGTPVEVISKALLVTVQTGALAGLQGSSHAGQPSRRPGLSRTRGHAPGASLPSSSRVRARARRDTGARPGKAAAVPRQQAECEAEGEPT